MDGLNGLTPFPPYFFLMFCDYCIFMHKDMVWVISLFGTTLYLAEITRMKL